MENKPTESPFVEAKQVRFNFSLMMILMLMVVAVGGSMLIFMAMKVPAFTTELRAYFGLTELVVDPEESRRAHLFFLLYLYSAPLGLGILVHIIHRVISWFNRITRPKRESDQFEMSTGIASNKTSGQ